MRILFLGTPDFAVPSLESLLEGPDQIAAVVTQPDRPQGRGLKTESCAIARCARAAGLALLQPERLAGDPFLSQVRDLNVDLGVTCAFGRILRRPLLEIPAHGFLNVHASLLPRHRGASPISRAILEGDLWTGVTIFRLDEGMDTGPILLQRTERILPTDSTGTLSDRLARLGAITIREACELIRVGNTCYEPQTVDGATHAPLLRKEDGIISWARPADQCERFVRAMEPWPGAATRFRGQPLKVSQIDLLDLVSRDALPGTLVAVDPFPIVTTLPGTIRLRRVQPAGRKELDAESWGRGARLEVGERLG